MILFCIIFLKNCLPLSHWSNIFSNRTQYNFKNLPKWNILKKILFLFLVFPFFLCFSGDTGKTVSLEFYSQPGCRTCEKIRTLILPELEDRYDGRFYLTEYDTSQKENFIRLLAILDRLEVQSNQSAHLLVNNSVLLAGGEIEEKIFIVMEQQLSSDLKQTESQLEQASWRTLLQNKAFSFSVGTVVIAGLADGINPCVFSTLVFFISILTVAKVRRRKLLLTGITYCLACFLTYFGLGCGLFYGLRILGGFPIMRRVLDCGMFFVLLLFALISFLDAVRFKRGKGKEGIWLKLPAVFSSRIHNLLKRGMSYHVLLPGIFLTGILVTILESVCTGQVYIPTLVLMAKETGGVKWFLLLLLYNLMFIFPLLLIFVIVYRGVSTMQLIRWSRHHIILSKYLLALLFLLLAILIFCI